MIYFLEDEKLAADLRENRVTEFDKFIYFMLLSIWGLIAGSSTYIAWTYHVPTPAERWLDIYIFVISVTGLWNCFERNKEGDNRDFITRITCLGFPAYVRMCFLGLLLYVPAELIRQKTDIGLTEPMIMITVNLIIWPYMYYRLYKTIGLTAGEKAA